LNKTHRQENNNPTVIFNLSKEDQVVSRKSFRKEKEKWTKTGLLDYYKDFQVRDEESIEKNQEKSEYLSK